MRLFCCNATRARFPSAERQENWRSRVKNSGLCLWSFGRPRRKQSQKGSITAQAWLESLVTDTEPDRKSSHSAGKFFPPDTSSSKEGEVSDARDTVGSLALRVVIHQSMTTSQHEMPRVHRPLVSLHMTQEPREGVPLGLLDQIRLSVLKKKTVSLRKHSAVEEISHHPYGIPQFEELHAATRQHVTFNRRKLFDIILPVANRRLAAASIINDFCILCPSKPSPHMKQMSRLRDRTRMCLIGRSTIGIPFEASDFMARWVYRRCLQTSELNGLQLTRITEQPDLEEDYNLSKIGRYQHTKCLASKLVAARRSARITDGIRDVASPYHVSMKYSVPQMPSLITIVEETGHASVPFLPSLSSVVEVQQEQEHHMKDHTTEDVPLVDEERFGLLSRKMADFGGDTLAAEGWIPRLQHSGPD